MEVPDLSRSSFFCRILPFTTNNGKGFGARKSLKGDSHIKVKG